MISFRSKKYERYLRKKYMKLYGLRKIDNEKHFEEYIKSYKAKVTMEDFYKSRKEKKNPYN